MPEQLPVTNAAIQDRLDIHPVQSIARFLRAVRYRKGVMVVTMVAAALLGALYYLTTPPVYQTNASLLVMQVGSDMLLNESFGQRMAKDNIPTYRMMLSSDIVLEDAITRLKPEEQVDLEGVPRTAWTGVLQANLKVTSTRDTNVLGVAYQSKKPEAAQAIVNCVLDAYIDFMHRLYRTSAREVFDLLTKEKGSLEEQLQAKQEERRQVRANAGELVIRDDQRNGLNVVNRRALGFNESWIKAQETRIDAQSRLVTIEAAIRNGEDLQQHALAMVDTVGRDVFLQRLGLKAMDPWASSRINERLMDGRSQLQAAMEIYGPRHREIRRLQEQIRQAEFYLTNQHQIETNRLREISNREMAPMLLGMARQRFAQAAAHESAIRASYEKEKDAAIGMDRTMTQLEILDLDLNRLRGFYDIVLQRLKDVSLGEENGILRTEILSRPEIPTSPIFPRLRIVGMLSVILGLIAGLAIVYLQDLLDDRFRSPEELRIQLGVPVHAMIRQLDPIEAIGVDALHVHVHPNADDTEAFRTLRTALELAEERPQRLVVSSSEPGDGKTTVVANLAAVYAQSGKRTLLIDADMRRPGLTPLLGLKGPQGLSTLLRDTKPVDQVAEENISPAVIENLDVLPSGPRPGNPTELLAGDRLSELLAWAEMRYDQILLDSPPALVSDTAIIGRLVDGVLLVVLPEKNRRRVVVRAAESFPALGIKVHGIVVNRLPHDGSEGYYGYGYGYGYGCGYGHDDEVTPDDVDLEDPIRPSKRCTPKAA